MSEKLPSYGSEWSGINVADGQDGIYNTNKAKEKFEKAKADLTIMNFL